MALDDEQKMAVRDFFAQIVINFAFLPVDYFLYALNPWMLARQDVEATSAFLGLSSVTDKAFNSQSTLVDYCIYTIKNFTSVSKDNTKPG